MAARAMNGAGMPAISTSAIEVLKATQQLPVLADAQSRPSAALLWGLGTCKWMAAPSGSAAPRDASHPARTLAMCPSLRTLIAASFDVRTRMQRIAVEKVRAGEEIAPQEIVRASREYRDALKTCIFELEDAPSDASSEDDDELIELLKVSLAIWHLCELLFLQRRARDDKWLAYDLAAWLNEHYSGAKMEALEQAVQHLRSLGVDQAIDQDPEYWPTIYGLVMMGCGKEAASLLALHPSHRAVFSADAREGASARESLQALQRLLLSMPGTAQQQQIEWQNWHDACLYLQSTDHFVRSDAGLNMLVKILTADPDALSANADKWYELMLARLYLEEPKATAHRAEFLMANCFQTYNPPSSVTMNNFDCIVMAILQYDVQSAIQDIHALGFHWMTVHLSDLLAKSNVLAIEEQVPEHDCSLREFFVLEYAIALSAGSGMWQLSLGYFQECSRFGTKLIRAALAREALTSSVKVQRLWSYCQGKKHLAHAQRQVALRWAMLCRQHREFAAALQWSLRASDLDQCDAICDEILHECQRSGTLTALNEAVEFLERHLVLARTKKMKWLIQYRELHLVLDDRHSLQQLVRENAADRTAQDKARFVSKEAAKRIHALLTVAIAPRCLWLDLLRVVESLLQEAPTVFSSEQLYGLMGCLRVMSRAFQSSDEDQADQIAAIAEMKTKIETLLARNLSDAFLAESGRGCSLATSDRESQADAAASTNPALLTNMPTASPLDRLTSAMED